jgi:hypothetical protein
MEATVLSSLGWIEVFELLADVLASFLELLVGHIARFDRAMEHGHLLHELELGRLDRLVQAFGLGGLPGRLPLHFGLRLLPLLLLALSFARCRP